MAASNTTLSVMERRTVQEVRSAGHKQYWAKQHSSASYLVSAAAAYIRSLAASALQSDPHSVTWKHIASAMKEEHLDIVLLGRLHLERASCLTGLYIEQLGIATCSILQSMVKTARTVIALSQQVMSPSIILSQQCLLQDFHKFTSQYMHYSL